MEIWLPVGIVIALFAATIIHRLRSNMGDGVAQSSYTPPQTQAQQQTVGAPSPTPQQPTNKTELLKKLPVRWLVATPVVICMAFAVYYFWTKDNKESPQRSVIARTTRVPLEVAKRVVCECETNCQQFEKNKDGNFVLDGEGKKIPTRNKGIPSKGIKPSDAFGKYQFREMHRKLALDLGFDLNTEEGQDRYFEYLYAKEDFGPWDHDEQFGGGRACWGPKLVALGYNPDGKGSGVPSPRIEEVAAEPGEWSQPVKNDRRFEKVRWYPNKQEGCEIRADEDDTKVFRCDQVLDLNVVPKTFSFRHKGKEPMTVEVRFTGPFTR